MAYKTIVVHCDGSSTVSARIGLAVDLARRFGSHVVGLHASAPFELPVFVDSSVASEALYEAWQTSATADRKAALAAWEKAVQGGSVASEWRALNGQIDGQLVVNARYADLVVVGQSDPHPRPGNLTPAGLPESVALASGRPVLVVPYIGLAKTPGKRVLLCWNAGKEAARAATEALPLLAAADSVTVLAIDAKRTATGHGDEPGADVATWLSRHGVKVTVQRDVAADADVGATILSRAADHDADLIVMGVYGHSRAREFLLGGASRTVLESMTVPVFIAH